MVFGEYGAKGTFGTLVEQKGDIGFLAVGPDSIALLDMALAWYGSRPERCGTR